MFLSSSAGMGYRVGVIDKVLAVLQEIYYERNLYVYLDETMPMCRLAI